MVPSHDDFINYLEQSRAIRVLILLHENKNKGLDEILDTLGGSKSTGMKRIHELMKLGLVHKEVREEHRKIFYVLSERGHKLAVLLKQVMGEYA